MSLRVIASQRGVLYNYGIVFPDDKLHTKR
jgi:hypothetical protein